MRARTEAEIKAYADGYKACYKEFCQCLKNNTAEQAIKKMGVFVVVVNNCVEVADTPQTDCGWKQPITVSVMKRKAGKSSWDHSQFWITVGKPMGSGISPQTTL